MWNTTGSGKVRDFDLLTVYYSHPVLHKTQVAIRRDKLQRTERQGEKLKKIL